MHGSCHTAGGVKDLVSASVVFFCPCVRAGSENSRRSSMDGIWKAQKPRLGGARAIAIFGLSAKPTICPVFESTLDGSI
jgi:hypothetical protein